MKVKWWKIKDDEKEQEEFTTGKKAEWRMGSDKRE